MSPIQTKSLINLLIFVPSLAFAAAMSTVSPYIQTAATDINAQVLKGMSTATSKVMAIKGRTEAGLKPQYEKKETMLEHIKKLQADSLLTLHQIQAASESGSGLRGVEARITGNSAQTDLISAEKTSVILNTELGHSSHK